MRSATSELESTAIEAEDIVVEYKTKTKGPTRAVDHVSLHVKKGETLGLVGESGSGKSSLGRSIVGLPGPTGGQVRILDQDMGELRGDLLRRFRRNIQLIFQDPIASLNPRRTALEIVSSSIQSPHRNSATARARELLAEVGVDSQMAERRPHELSGGQCQRIAIARALAQDASILVCDEPVSALDVSVQAQVMNLLEDLKLSRGITMLFISHDLSVVANISDRVAVMHRGRIVEVAPSEILNGAPRHHYTALLLSAIPGSDFSAEDVKMGYDAESRVAKNGNRWGLPSKGDGPDQKEGCRFASRCPAASDLCFNERPPLIEQSENHLVACHHPVQSESN